MTNKDIYTKFMIEYDKANITSSYPSLTQFESATILDKAYLALIGRKITGNNPRRSLLESDIKAVEDLRPLICTRQLLKIDIDLVAKNEYVYRLPVMEDENYGPEMLYYLGGQVTINSLSVSSIDTKEHSNQNVILLDHEQAAKFRATDSNVPWIKTPVSFLEGPYLHLLIDPYKQHQKNALLNFYATYIKKPAKFVNHIDDTVFELSDTMAEEMINLAVLFAIENVESTRLLAKTSTIPLEA